MQIALTRGMYATIDDADFPLIDGRSWVAVPATKTKDVFYAKAWFGKSCIYMHRLIAAAGPDRVVDHINRNGLDNRRANLRLATVGENNINRRVRLAASGFRGVYPARDKYSARIWKGGRSIGLGIYATAQEAAKAFDAAARELHGDFAALNFPDA